MKVVLFGSAGKVGRSLEPRLREAGHEVLGVRSADQPELAGYDVAIDFTSPGSVLENVRSALTAGLAALIGTTGLTEESLAELDALARERGLPCFRVPNFAVGAVLMMRFAIEARQRFRHAEIIELHDLDKADAPSGTALATASGMGGDVPIHSVRLPGLIAHQEVIFGGRGETLTIRHDTSSRDAFAPGVLIALERMAQLPAGLSVGLETVL